MESAVYGKGDRISASKTGSHTWGIVVTEGVNRGVHDYCGATVESELLLAVCAVFPDELDGFDLSQPALADAERRHRWREGVLSPVSHTIRGRQWLNCGAKIHGPRISPRQKKTLSHQQDQFSM
jgi:hypothetical protein